MMGQQIVVPLIATSLAFSPLRLVLLICWVHCSLYCVQRACYSPLLGPKSRPWIMVLCFSAGPIVLPLVVVVYALRVSLETGATFIESLADCLSQLIANVSHLGVLSHKDKEERITLLDSSGRSIEQIYGHEGKKRSKARILTTTEDIISQALRERSSDILIDPKNESEYTVRFRVDGMLRTVYHFESDTCKAIVNSLKAISSMDIAEKRRPQDGAFIARTGGATASFRVASAGVLNGEKMSIRVLNQDAGKYTLEDTGLSPKQLKIAREMLHKPNGMILICGPTGSGKTTTLYAMLNEMDRFTRNVVTVEDPIEAYLPEASQIEINAKADITFAKALRSILRQDPDVICVGEIRDEETAEIALRAAQTGHLVLATLHCDSNAAAIVRLLDLGVSPLLLASGLRMILSQRLLRCLCPSCKEPKALSAAQTQEFRRKQIDYQNLYEPEGCPECHQTGYRGRTAVGDIIVMTEELKNGLLKHKNFIAELRSSGSHKGMSNLSKQGLRKAMSGITSFDEIKRVLG